MEFEKHIHKDHAGKRLCVVLHQRLLQSCFIRGLMSLMWGPPWAKLCS